MIILGNDHPHFQRKTPDEFLEEINQAKRGKFKLYVGAAPGVGKSYRMLQDAHELKRDGVDIVIGLIESHGRIETEAQIKGLESVPLKEIIYKGKKFYELNVNEIFIRKPEIVIVDELAHTNIKGSLHPKRYLDVEDLLEAGISVFSAVNIQHLESVYDIIQQICGIKVRERLPDKIFHIADEIQLIDVTPETLRKRLSEGKVYSSRKIEQSLNNFFTTEKLSALRELTLREVANDVDERIERITMEGEYGSIGILEKILVCIHYGPTAEKLIRRGWRMAQRLKAELFILNVLPDENHIVHLEREKKLREWKILAEQFNATFIVEKQGRCSPAEIIILTAKSFHITQILLGQSARTRWEEICKGSIVNTIMRKTSNIDIHIVADSR